MKRSSSTPISSHNRPLVRLFAARSRCSSLANACSIGFRSPALAEKRLSLTPGGNVRYHFKTPWRDGTTHVVFEPLDFIARLAALVPKPRVNLTRFHGVFAPNSRYRAFMPFGYA